MMRSEDSARDGLPATRTRFDVTVQPVNRRFVCAPDQSVLKAMIAGGHRMLAVGCRSGGCGVCRVRVTSGRYISQPMSRARISPAEERDGVVLACRIFPRTDLVVEPLPQAGLVIVT